MYISKRKQSLCNFSCNIYKDIQNKPIFFKSGKITTINYDKETSIYIEWSKIFLYFYPSNLWVFKSKDFFSFTIYDNSEVIIRICFEIFTKISVISNVFIFNAKFLTKRFYALSVKTIYGIVFTFRSNHNITFRNKTTVISNK